MTPVADDFPTIAARLAELRREANARTGVETPSPVDAGVRPCDTEATGTTWRIRLPNEYLVRTGDTEWFPS